MIDRKAWLGPIATSLQETLSGSGVAATMQAPVYPGGAYVLDLESDSAIGQLLIWPTGITEASVMHINWDEREHVGGSEVVDLQGFEAEVRQFVRRFLEVHAMEV